MKCFFGHKWLQIARGVDSERWYKTYDGRRIEGTGYSRDIYTIIEKCSKCDKKRAWRGYGSNYINTALDPEFAAQEIAKLNGGQS